VRAHGVRLAHCRDDGSGDYLVAALAEAGIGCMHAHCFPTTATASAHWCRNGSPMAMSTACS
jgi:hypothetical protein